MSLLVNEIHVHGTLQQSVIIFAADRRMGVLGRFHSPGRKIFRVEHLNAGIGFFGVAEVFSHGKKQPMSGWLAQFIMRNGTTKTLAQFADTLKRELDDAVPSSVRISTPSGFHIAGYNESNLPEFWFVRNFKAMDPHRYKAFDPHYSVSEDFLARDARRHGFDGTTPTVKAPFTWTYRNGDIRAHVPEWERLDDTISNFLSLPDFKKAESLRDYERLVKFRMRLIATIYKEYCPESNVGTQIDVFSIRPGMS